MKLLILIPAFLFALVATALAQPGDNEFFDDKVEQIRAQKVAFITNKLNLSVEESQKFWPVYNEFSNKKDDIQAKRREYTHALTIALPSLAEKDVEARLDLIAALDMSEAQLKQEYHLKFKSVLPPSKVFLLYRAEHEFTRYMLKRYREGQSGGGPGGGFRGGQ